MAPDRDDNERDVWEAQAERIRHFEAWQKGTTYDPSLCLYFLGRFELLTVDDIKFLWDCGIDPLS